MIKELTQWNFRKVEHETLIFTPGLNVLRGANEASKTTRFEGILYALYGTSALVDTLEQTVTWGRKESELKVRLVIEISGTDYTFSRSKAGAEVNYVVDGLPVKVAGQKEVSAFASSLMGADAKTASVLMLSSQAGLRGALSEGATAVGALMGKLADFDTIDTLLQNANATLALGSIVPVQEKLAAADLEVLAATSALLDPAALAAVDANLVKVADEHAIMLSKVEALTDALTKADVARDVARSNNSSVEAAGRRVTEVQTALRLEQARLAAALDDVAKCPASDSVKNARDAVLAAAGHAERATAYAAFTSLTYPAVSWDDTKESFDVALAESIEKKETSTLAVRQVEGDIGAELRRMLQPGAACKSCGHKSDDPSHMEEHNASVKARVAELRIDLATAQKAAGEAVGELNDMLAVQRAANTLHATYAAIKVDLAYDHGCYPAKVAWIGTVPGDAPNVRLMQSALDNLVNQERLATQAEGRAAAHRTTIAEHETALTRATAVAAGLKPVDLVPVDAAYEAAFQVYTAHNVVTRDLGYALEDLKAQKAAIERAANDAQQRLTNAQARVAEYVADIKALEFNNELVKKLKSMKPMITDHLWNKVLAAVGNYFSVLRGEQSIVTKDATGFRVNGRGGSLSGSTLDMLALAIRVALSKTFVPHANFMVLDEPAHGCDNVRASALLGFLSGVGFQQTILASHDELSESVADNVILLGA